MDDYRLLRLLEGRPIQDNRKRHRPGRKNPTKTNWERRNIIAWDGEGANVECDYCCLDWTMPHIRPSRFHMPHDCQGEHIYNLLANSFGHYVLNHEGLTTEQVLNFMLKESKPQAINVIYGGSYDVNMLLRDLPPDKIRTLWENGSVYWGNYGISYAHRKRFSVRYYDHASGRKAPVYSFVLWDVLGFFQKSFVESCRAWFGKELSSHLPILDKIEAMKYQRSTFSVEQIEEIIAYNHAECKLLVLLVQQLFAALDEADIQLTRYDGAGSIAAALLRKNNILEHMGDQDSLCKDNPESYLWARHAYSGGRIEAVKVGNLEDGKIYRDDINSAYPAAALNLPSLAGAYFTMDPLWDGNDYSMVDIEWAIRGKQRPFYPLWYRNWEGRIIYPRMGRGRYWGYEARLMQDYFEEGKDYIFHSACNCHLALDAKPFDFLRHDYSTRQRFNEEGSKAGDALKLGMNSVYGKLAQQAGARNGRIPTYHNLYWAGQITSSTRAALFRAAMQRPNSVIAFATDAIISTSKLALQRNAGLGSWTHERLSGITLVQAGVYWLKQGPEWLVKYRGFDQGSLEREDVVRNWALNRNYEARLTRFYGMGSAVGLNNFKDYWRVWRTETRTLDLQPQGKRTWGKDTNYHERLCATTPAINFDWYDTWLYPHITHSISYPFPIAWCDDYKNPRLVRTDNGLEDLREMEWESLDSYA